MIAPCYLMIPMYSGIWQNYTTLLTQYLTKVLLGTLAVSVTRHSWSDSLISNNNPVKSWSTIYPKYFQQQKRFNNSLGIDKSVLSAQKHLFWNYFNFYTRKKIKIFEILFYTKNMFMRVTIVCGEIFFVSSLVVMTMILTLTLNTGTRAPGYQRPSAALQLSKVWPTPPSTIIKQYSYTFYNNLHVAEFKTKSKNNLKYSKHKYFHLQKVWSFCMF